MWTKEKALIACTFIPSGDRVGGWIWEAEGREGHSSEVSEISAGTPSRGGGRTGRCRGRRYVKVVGSNLARWHNFLGPWKTKLGKKKSVFDAKKGVTFEIENPIFWLKSNQALIQSFVLISNLNILNKTLQVYSHLLWSKCQKHTWRSIDRSQDDWKMVSQLIIVPKDIRSEILLTLFNICCLRCKTRFNVSCGGSLTVI